jgi:hypothetical protein
MNKLILYFLLIFVTIPSTIASAFLEKVSFKEKKYDILLESIVTLFVPLFYISQFKLNNSKSLDILNNV